MKITKVLLMTSLFLAFQSTTIASPPSADIFDVNRFNTDSSYKTDFNNYAMEYTDASGKKYYMLGKRSPITGNYEAIYYLDADKLEYDNGKFKFKDGYNQENFMTDSVVISTLPSGITIQSTDKNGNNVTSSITSNGEITTTGFVHAKGFTADNGKLTEISDGEISETSQEAINESQLYKALKNLKFDNVNYNAIGANVASLAALQPLPFDEDNKLNFALGFGKYKSESSLALGLFYTPHKDLRLSTGFALGNDSKNVFNMGLSFRFGKKAKESFIAKDDDFKNQITYLTNENHALKQEIILQGERIKKLEERLDMLLSHSSK